MERVKIAENYVNQPDWKIYLGVPLIYLPLIAMIPFVIVGVLLIKTHLKFVGGMNIRSYWDFVPTWVSHRYRYDNQITYSTGSHWYNLRSLRFYWIFNCKVYCPLSVALFRYCVYLVMIVENWWCPFEHDKKSEYDSSSIDKSFWHLQDPELGKLHPDDRNNPIWNADSHEKNK